MILTFWCQLTQSLLNRFVVVFLDQRCVLFAMVSCALHHFIADIEEV